MTIAVGDRIPSATLHRMTADGPEKVTTDDLFAGKRVAVFGLPGAFTPTCSARHVPGFLAKAEAFRAKGVDRIVCVSVNDAWVMDAWGKSQGVGDDIAMLADGGGAFTKALGLAIDLTGAGLGVRSKRYSMLVEDGVVKALHAEEATGLTISDADTLLADL